MESGGLNILISTLTESEDAELSRAIKYILQGCVDTGIISLKVSQHTA